jgi:dihydrofolate reductase
MISLRAAQRISVHVLWVATCLGHRKAAIGVMTHGRVGGVITRPITPPVFVLTHYPRASITMDGGTTFHFVTDGIQAALKRAIEAAHGKDIRLAGGVAAIRHYLQAGLIDQMHLAIAPILLGSGEALLSGIDTLKLGYVLTEHVQTAKATHIVLTKRK